MSYRGHIKNGAVVLDEPVQLPEGAQVNVDLTPVERPVPLAELFKDLIGPGRDLPPDAARNKRHYLYGHRKT
jgi:hypothetical protein